MQAIFIVYTVSLQFIEVEGASGGGGVPSYLSKMSTFVMKTPGQSLLS